PLDRIIVAFAGPLFSFLLAVFFAFIVAAVGKPVTEAEWTTTIGAIAPNSPAQEAPTADGKHWQPGDTIVSIDGHPVNHWEGMGQDGVHWRIISSEGDTINLKVKRG